MKKNNIIYILCIIGLVYKLYSPEKSNKRKLNFSRSVSSQTNSKKQIIKKVQVKKNQKFKKEELTIEKDLYDNLPSPKKKSSNFCEEYFNFDRDKSHICFQIEKECNAEWDSFLKNEEDAEAYCGRDLEINCISELAQMKDEMHEENIINCIQEKINEDTDKYDKVINKESFLLTKSSLFCRKYLSNMSNESCMEAFQFCISAPIDNLNSNIESNYKNFEENSIEEVKDCIKEFF